MKPKIALYPGTFDPITNGHIDIIERAGNIFDGVIVAVAESSAKQPMFPLDKRKKLIEIATAHCKNLQIISFDNLLVDLAEEIGTKIIVRGLRAVSDFEYELQMGYANASLDPEIETIYLMPNLPNAFISSSVVRTILCHNGDVSHLVPKSIMPLLKSENDVLDI